MLLDWLFILLSLKCLAAPISDTCSDSKIGLWRSLAWIFFSRLPPANKADITDKSGTHTPGLFDRVGKIILYSPQKVQKPACCCFFIYFQCLISVTFEENLPPQKSSLLLKSPRWLDWIAPRVQSPHAWGKGLRQLLISDALRKHRLTTEICHRAQESKRPM